MKVSPKYYDFIMDDAKVDILEGTTSSGKTTTAINTKFVYKVMKSKRKKHLIAAESLGVIISNILSNGEYGLLDVYPEIQASFNGSHKQKLPHIRIGDNIVFLVGYSDIAKFKKVLGGQFGVVFIDECNMANQSFINELFLPRFEYCCMTLNPDNPDKKIYKDIINRARPLEKYAHDIPASIFDELNQTKAQDNWRYWFMSFDDNPSMTLERKTELLNSLLPETLEYQTKILGLRTIGTGQCVPLPKENIISLEQLKELKLNFKTFSIGIDTSYSDKTDDKISMHFIGISNTGILVVLDEITTNNKENKVNVTPSDVAKIADDFWLDMVDKWGNTLNLFIDSADSATIMELDKYRKGLKRPYLPTPSWKKTTIMNRVNLMNSWIKSKHYLVVDQCKNLINEHKIWVYNEKGEPMDGNDHSINSSQYAWLPFKTKIGVSNETKRHRQ